MAELGTALADMVYFGKKRPGYLQLMERVYQEFPELEEFVNTVTERAGHHLEPMDMQHDANLHAHKRSADGRMGGRQHKKLTHSRYIHI